MIHLEKYLTPSGFFRCSFFKDSRGYAPCGYIPPRLNPDRIGMMVLQCWGGF